MSVPDPPTHRSANRPSWPSLLVLGAGGILLAAVAVVTLRPPPRESSRRALVTAPAAGEAASGQFAGSRVCRECHPGEHALYSRSGHSRTLHTAATTALAQHLNGRTVPDPERPDVTWKYDLLGSRFTVTRSEPGKADQYEVQYAFGSDHHATTFVTVTDPARPTAIEHRLTHFASDDVMAITPGQRAASPAPGTTPHGRELSPEETLKCFRCHATRISAASDETLDPATTLANVTCERCHGPGRSHVDAARAGQTELTMPNGLGQWTAESQLWFCGQCHRNPSKTSEVQIRPGNRALARFQPVGLQQSECYQKSAGGLSCVTCHDPHMRASADRASYTPACVKCHDAPPRSVCPVSPRSGCVDCHMPRVDSGQRVLFTDHWIRIHPEFEIGADRPAAPQTAPHSE